MPTKPTLPSLQRDLNTALNRISELEKMTPSSIVGSTGVLRRMTTLEFQVGTLNQKTFDLKDALDALRAQLASPQTDASHVHARIDFLEDRMTDMEARVPKTAPVEVNVTADTESLTAYIHRLETLINDIEKGLSNRLDVHRTDINRLEQRISDCELAVGTDKLEPAPQRDTSWHPYDVLVEGVIGDHPKGDERVVVMIRGRDAIVGPAPATCRNWDEQGDSTIVAWRYAKEGE